MLAKSNHSSGTDTMFDYRDAGGNEPNYLAGSCMMVTGEAECLHFCYIGWCMLASANTMNLVERVKNILLQPKVEWPVIEPEYVSVQALYTGYIMPLASIGPVAMLIGMSIIGIEIPSVGTVRIPLPSLFPQMVVGYGLGLAAVYALALIIDALAPTFGGTSDRMQALKVAAYGATASWVGGIFHLVPALGILGLLAGCYTLYLFYLGLPVLMKSSPERSLGYAIAIMVAAVVLTAVVGILSAVFVEFPAPGNSSPSELLQPQGNLGP